MLDKASLNILVEALEKLDAGFAALPANETQAPGADRISRSAGGNGAAAAR